MKQLFLILFLITGLGLFKTSNCDTPPNGSYQQSCNNIKYDAATDTLSATCDSYSVERSNHVKTDPTPLKRIKTEKATSLKYASYCGDISNKNGQLVCWMGLY